MTTDDRAVLERFKKLVGERVPVWKLVLFGSRARGNATAESDVDVLVVLDSAVDGKT